MMQITIPTHPLAIRKARLPEMGERCAAARGAAAMTTSARRLAPGTLPFSGTTSSVFVAPAHFPSSEILISEVLEF